MNRQLRWAGGRLGVALMVAGASGCAAGTPTSSSAVVPSYQLTGRVIDAGSGLAINGATMSALNGPNAGKAAKTGADGRYTLPGLAAGSFTLRAQGSGFEDHLQEITVTSDTNIDLRMTPLRGVDSGWSGGTLVATIDGQAFGARITTAQVTQGGNSLNGLFTCADGSNGTFTGQLAGGRFTGSMRLEIIFNNPGRRCRATSANVTGPASGQGVTLSTPSMALENCSASVTDVTLTLTP